ncbi:MAG TPA: hypothetical protein VIC85_10885 [Ktedonobacterales bacterium]|jgi:hypothetical protein
MEHRRVGSVLRDRFPGALARRAALAAALMMGAASALASCGVGGINVGHSGTPVPEGTTVASVCRAQGLNYSYQPSDAVEFNPYLKCVMNGLIGEIGTGKADVAYLVETFKNCNPDDQQTVAGWTLYTQDPLHPVVTATPGQFTGVGPTAPLYTADTPTRKGCFSGAVSIIKSLTGVPLPGNITLEQLRSGVLIFNEGLHMTDPTPFNHPALIVTISEHLSHCPCDIQRLNFLPGDPVFLGTAAAPGRVAMEARIVYLGS